MLPVRPALRNVTQEKNALRSASFDSLMNRFFSSESFHVNRISRNLDYFTGHHRAQAQLDSLFFFWFSISTDCVGGCFVCF